MNLMILYRHVDALYMRKLYFILLESPLTLPFGSLPFWAGSVGPEIKSKALFIYTIDYFNVDIIASPFN